MMLPCYFEAYAFRWRWASCSGRPMDSPPRRRRGSLGPRRVRVRSVFYTRRASAVERPEVRQALTSRLIEQRYAFKRIDANVCPTSQFLQDQPVHRGFITVQIEYLAV